jgi:segregation and condensation protein B
VSEPTDVVTDDVATPDALTEVDLRDRAGEPGPDSAVVPEVVDLREHEPPAAGAPDAGAPDIAARDIEAPDVAAREPEVVGAVEQPEEETGLLDLDAFPMGARGAVEAVLMVVDEPVAEAALASALGLPLQRLRDLLGELAAEYDEAGRGFELRQVAGGWRIYSRAEYAAVVERFMLDGQTAKLTQAALETLAIVAYRQPVSRARVGAVRGVNVDAVMRTLSSRGLVEEAGNDPESGALLYRTTPYFLQRIGLRSLDELPALAPYLPEVDALDELGAGASS